jgi:hypothetical protein
MNNKKFTIMDRNSRNWIAESRVGKNHVFF